MIEKSTLKLRAHSIVAWVALFAGSGAAFSQMVSPNQPVCGFEHAGQCLKDVVKDQAGVWGSPFHVKAKDASWLIPLAGATALALHYDMQAQKDLGIDQSRIDKSNKIAAFGSPYATIGAGAGVYLVGLGTHNEHVAETGRLGMEAVVDASIVAGALKFATNRQRLNSVDEGQFWPQGTSRFDTNSSFPSGHAAASWAIARVIAAEYPNKGVKLAAYAFATAISVSRVTGRAHFPSDVVVGSALGYLIGGYVTHHHASEWAQIP